MELRTTSQNACSQPVPKASNNERTMRMFNIDAHSGVELESKRL
jgi:hypothetical protein